MNNQIKFRIWFGNQFNYVDLSPGKSSSLIVSIQNPETCIWQQYTGLKDKNGKEIYRGDIVKDRTELIWEVIFDNGKFSVKHNNAINDLVGISSFGDVIGNIFQNPELLNA